MHTISTLIFGLLFASCMWQEAYGRAVRDSCLAQPTINGLCVTSTLGIYYDAETQHCKYMGCSPNKKLFATLEDCERICNNNRHRRRRVQQQQASSSGSGPALA